MRLEIGIPAGCKMSSRFCFVCGKIGTTTVNGGSWLNCYRHAEGLVQWAVYETPIRVMTNAGKEYLV